MPQIQSQPLFWPLSHVKQAAQSPIHPLPVPHWSQPSSLLCVQAPGLWKCGWEVLWMKIRVVVWLTGKLTVPSHFRRLSELDLWGVSRHSKIWENHLLSPFLSGFFSLQVWLPQYPVLPDAVGIWWHDANETLIFKQDYVNPMCSLTAVPGIPLSATQSLRMNSPSLWDNGREGVRAELITRHCSARVSSYMIKNEHKVKCLYRRDLQCNDPALNRPFE